MKFFGLGLLLILPLALIVVLLLVVLPFTLIKPKTILKETKEKIDEEKQKMLNKIQGDKKCLSKEERQSLSKKMRDYIRNKQKETQKAIEDEMGLDDWKKGNKEIRDDLKNTDIRDIFK
jgi:sugar-specific transcriptional regulator TrmB